MEGRGKGRRQRNREKKIGKRGKSVMKMGNENVCRLG